VDACLPRISDVEAQRRMAGTRKRLREEAARKEGKSKPKRTRLVETTNNNSLSCAFGVL
jgi:hypothetical protein